MHAFAPSDYVPVFAALLGGDRYRALDAGAPNESARSVLKQATLAAAFAPAKIVDRDMAQCCLAGMWLLLDFLDESHTISQSVATSSGSYWHAVMHRREGDFSNAKYWFRRVGSHNVLDELGAHVVALATDVTSLKLAEGIVPAGQLDPYALVDACENAVRQGGPAEAFCRRIQQAEWERLFIHCYRGAVGS